MDFAGGRRVEVRLAAKEGVPLRGKKNFVRHDREGFFGGGMSLRREKQTFNVRAGTGGKNGIARIITG